MTFNIVQLDDGKGERVPVSYKIREYFDRFILEEILIPNKIIVADKWHHKIAIQFDYDNTNWIGISDKIIAIEGVTLFPSRTFASDRIKSYGLLFSYSKISDSSNPSQEYTKLIFDGLKLFFQTNFKKVSKDLLDRLEKKIDYTYLNSLPYPASFEEQKYEGDNNGARVKVTSFTSKS
jgi:hypothetical protein